MRKIYFVYTLSIALFVSDCAVNKRTIPQNNIIADIDQKYDLSKYSVAVKTDDHIYYLANLKIQANGDLRADITTKPTGGKEIRFITKSKSQKAIKNVPNSSGSETNAILFSGNAVWGVDLLDTLVKPQRHLIYKQHMSSSKKWISIGLYVLLGVVAFFTVIGLFGLFFSLAESGCYIATMVYGSYDAPEVLVLRKFRDEKLAPYFLGRLFIRTYYFFSPTFVSLFKSNKPINKFIKSILDKWVNHLVVNSFGMNEIRF